MKIRMNKSVDDLPDMIETVDFHVQLKDILAESTMSEVLEILISDEEEILWDDYHRSQSHYNGIRDKNLAKVYIERDSRLKATKAINVSVGEFLESYPAYFDFMESLQEEFNEYRRKHNAVKVTVEVEL